MHRSILNKWMIYRLTTSSSFNQIWYYWDVDFKQCFLHFDSILSWPYLIQQNIHRENFCGFHGFSLNCESFCTNYGLVDWQFKSTSMIAWKFLANNHFPLCFPPWMFCCIQCIWLDISNKFSSKIIAQCNVHRLATKFISLTSR